MISEKEFLKSMNQQFKELMSIYHDFANYSGISENEFWILYALLVLEGDFSQQDICDLWSLPKQTVNTIVSRLAKNGYVNLECIPKTKNRKRISLTKRGQAYGQDIVFGIYQAELNALRHISEEEKKIFIQVLHQYIYFMKIELKNGGDTK